MSDVTAAGGKQVKDNSKLLDKPPVHQSSWSSDITAAAGYQVSSCLYLCERIYGRIFIFLATLLLDFMNL